MSAHKRTTISISEEEYRKLHEGTMRMRFVKKELPKIAKELRRETEAAIQNSVDAMNLRQQRFIETIDQFQDDVQATEWHTTQELLNRQEDLWHSFDEFAGDMWNQTTASLFNQREEFFQQFQAEHDQRQADIMQLSAQILSSEQEQDRRWEMAKNWLDAAYELRDFINSNYNHQKFTPENFKHYNDLLIQASQNLEQDIPETALMGAQQAYRGFSDLHINLEKQTAQWEVYYYAVGEKTKQLIRFIDNVRNCKAVDLEGNELDFDLNVDYWTEGKLSEQIDYVTSLLEQLETRAGILDLSMLQNLLEETVPTIQSKIENLVATARMNVISSQIRVNIADIVLHALEEQGFALQKSGYVQADMRHSFLASAKNLEGSEIVIQVDPVSGVETKNELHLHSFDQEMRTHHELRQRAKEINRAITMRGLQVGATSTQPDVHEDLMQNVLPVERIHKQARGE